MATASIPRLADFYISEKTGFLIEEPLTSLPSFFDPWNDIGRNLADLLTQHSLREVVDKMPLLDHARLTGHRQWRLAHTILSFIGHGYVWQEGETTPAKKIPRQLAIPWYGVSSYLGLHPAVAQVNTVLSNWQIIDPARPMSVDNMRLICEFPGGTHCRWFFMTTGQIEMDVIHGLKMGRQRLGIAGRFTV
jgi:indoleamine 2,3-dioxygenase